MCDKVNCTSTINILRMEDNENTTPPIKCGYCGWFIEGLLSTSLLEHKCFQSFDEDTHFLHIDDCNIAKIIEKDQSSSTNQINSDPEDYNECLITAVQARRGLYDHQIPLKERTSLKKKALWKEVLNVLGENENNMELVQKRWKQLRDSYVKAKRKDNEYISSGSAASSKTLKIGFSLYNQMKFLDDVIGKSSTITSLSNRISIDEQTDDTELSIDHERDQSPLRVMIPQTSNISSGSERSSWGASSSPSPSQNNQQQKTKRSRTCDNNSDIKRAILSALESDVKKPDAVDGFLLQIGDRLRVLPPRERAQFEIKILSQLFELEQNLSIF